MKNNVVDALIEIPLGSKNKYEVDLDYKLISVVDCDPRYEGVDKLEHLPAFILKEIANFFENYKTLQNIKVEVGSYYSKDEAIAIVAECREQFRSHMET